MYNTRPKFIYAATVISLAGFLALNFAFKHSASERAIIVRNLDIEYLEGCETGKGDCSAVEIVRHSLADSVMLVFPKGGTETEVYLSATSGDEVYLSNKKFAGEEKPQLSLGKLKDGEYKAGIRSCGLGAVFKLKLRTEELK